ncbi:MAG: TonB-dependent receptor domain-containing protein [Candidatus Aminicenantaceae bacterium]
MIKDRINVKNKFFLFIALFISLLISFLNSFPQGKIGSIQGRVVDRVTQQPLPQVSVSILGAHFKTETNNKGQFRFEVVPVGIYQLLYHREGYRPIVISDVVVGTGHINQQFIEMDLAVIEEKITVTADYFSKEPTSFTSTRNLTYEEVRRMPGAAEDISRVIQSMPGVAVSGDMKNDIIVRGGSPSENLFIIDNIQIPNINHFGAQGASGGAIGLVNTDFIHDMNFYSGGFPAAYGDKLSSALKIILREGNRRKFSGDVNLSIAGFGGTFEGPLFLKKGSWMFSLRRSYLELLSGLSLGLTAVPDYWDFQTKVVCDLSKRNQISILGIGGIDRIRIKNFDDPFVGYLQVDSKQREYILGISLKSLWGKSGYSILTLSRSFNKFFYDVSDEEEKLYKSNSFEKEDTLKYDFEYSLVPRTQVSAGISVRRIEADNNIFIKGGYSPFGFYQPPKDIKLHTVTSKAAAYIQLSHHFSSRLQGTFGLRGGYFDYIRRFSLSPRIGFSFQISSLHTINFSYGIYYQSPEYLWLISHPDNSSLRFLRADHLIIGWEILLRKDTKLSIEVFNKEYKNYPVDVNNYFFSLANSGGYFGPSFLGGKLVSQGTGFARGVEFFIRKKLAKKLYGLINYSFSRVKFKALDGVLRPGDFDYRHIFTSIIGYKPSDKWEFSLKWRYTGARPYTPYDEELSKIYKDGRINVNKINALRFPPYHRLDLRVDRRFHFKNWNLVVYFDLQNAYDRGNIYGFIWDKKEEKVATIYQWRIMPVGGFSIEF